MSEERVIETKIKMLDIRIAHLEDEIDELHRLIDSEIEHLRTTMDRNLQDMERRIG